MTNANNDFKQHTCSETYYKHMMGFLLSEGAQALCEKCQSFWLADIIVSHQLYPKVRGEEFQVWKLSRVKEDTFKVTCEDGNKNVVTQQKIPYSDFPFDEATLWCVDKIILLPSEY